ncbi:GNAT family N-acetyltransferase [Candidatus Bathyarchaeota archaeon]|nr:GNAT family N-acetyltransferase [Candidatus Bathyarchaeota archaeon]
MPQYRKMGIEYTLFYHLLESIRQKGFARVRADTGLIQSDAIKMYSRFGFRIVTRQHAWIKMLQQ